jgi:hypothetical protein
MPRRKTHRRKHQSKKRKTHRRQRRGGMNHSNFGPGNGSYANAYAAMANQNDAFDDRRADLINTLTDIIERAEAAVEENPNADYIPFIMEIESLRQEAIDIDAYFGNDDMVYWINQRIHDIIDIFGINPPNNNNVNINNNNNNNNNNDRTIINNSKSIRNNNNNNKNNKMKLK